MSTHPALAGIDFASRGRRLDELIEVMRKLWTGREVVHHGEFFDFEHAILCPGPSAPVPIFGGGASPPALRRAARLDGWFGVPSTREQILPYVEKLRQERESLLRSLEVALAGDEVGADNTAGTMDEITAVPIMIGMADSGLEPLAVFTA